MKIFSMNENADKAIISVKKGLMPLHFRAATEPVIIGGLGGIPCRKLSTMMN
jgi:hypothetical protein